MFPTRTAIVAFIATATIALAAPSSNSTYHEKRDTVLKPVMNGQNFPDPSLLRVGNDYYAYATSTKINGQRIHIQMARSLSSFDNWTWMGAKDALPILPHWIDADSPQVWAPDVVQLESGGFVMYYTAALKSNPKLHCLGVATSGAMLGPFTPTDMTEPWVCPSAQGGAIDPAGYFDETDKTRWVVYKVDGNAIGHGGICNNGNDPIVPTPILLQQVSTTDGHTKMGSPSHLMTNGKADGPVVEAPSLSKMDDGTFVLFFSSNCFATPLYDVSYATSRSIGGPYTKYGPMFVTGSLGLTAPGGLDIAVNGYRAVFHANYGTGRAMFTALIGGGGNKWQAYTQTS